MGKPDGTHSPNVNIDHFLSTLKKYHRKSIAIHRSSIGGIVERRSTSGSKGSNHSNPTVKNVLTVPLGGEGGHGRKGSRTKFTHHVLKIITIS